MALGSLAALREALQDDGLSLADVKANQGSGAVPKGHYVLEVVHYQQTVSSEQSKNPGALLYKVGFKVVSKEYKGSRVWMNNSVTLDNYDRAWGLMVGLFTAVGVSKKEIDGPDFDPTDEWGKQNVIGQVVESDIYVTPAKGDFKEGNGFDNFVEHEMTSDDLLND